MAVAMVMAVASLTAMVSADANIVNTDYWDSHSVAAMDGVKVEEGIALSDDPLVQFMLVQGRSRAGHSTDIDAYDNVARVKRVFNEAKYNDWTEQRADIYTYNNFLRAVAKYPAFCGEANSPRGLSDDDACKRALATLFANINYASDDLSETSKDGCSGGTDCPRGPLMIELSEYNDFSSSFYDGLGREEELITNESRVSTDGYVSWSSAIWRYVTPAASGPSALGVMSGYFTPNASDIGIKHYAGFGTTMVILNTAVCTWSENNNSLALQSDFESLIDSIGLNSSDEDNLSCAQAQGTFAWNGSQNKMWYFVDDWAKADHCKLVNWASPYSARDTDAYKRCACDLNPNIDRANCEAISYADPSEEDSQPDEGDSQPDEGDSQPDEGDSQPDEGDSQPDEGDSQPDEGDSQPDEGDSQPDEGDSQPDDNQEDSDNDSNPLQELLDMI